MRNKGEKRRRDFYKGVVVRRGEREGEGISFHMMRHFQFSGSRDSSANKLVFSLNFHKFGVNLGLNLMWC